MHAPVCSKHPLDGFPRWQWLFFDLNDEIQHREALSVCSTLFTQCWSHQLSMRKTLFEAGWQRNDGVHFAPLPDSCLIGIAEAKLGYSCIQIESQTICLALFTPVIACICQHPNFEQRDRLEFFIIDGKAI